MNKKYCAKNPKKNKKCHQILSDPVHESAMIVVVNSIEATN